MLYFCCCTISIAVLFLLLYSFYCCTLSIIVLFLLLYSLCCCTLSIVVLFLLLYSFYFFHFSGLIDIAHGAVSFLYMHMHTIYICIYQLFLLYIPASILVDILTLPMEQSLLFTCNICIHFSGLINVANGAVSSLYM